MDSDKEALGIILAAIIGSFIGTASRRNDGILTIIVSVVSGISSSYIFTPIVRAYVASDLELTYAIAFLLGLLGMSLISILMSVVDAFRGDPSLLINLLKDFISRKSTTIINQYGETKIDKDDKNGSV